jgi:hypothetical protein
LHEESAAVLPGWCHVEWSVALQADHGWPAGSPILCKKTYSVEFTFLWKIA